MDFKFLYQPIDSEQLDRYRRLDEKMIEKSDEGYRFTDLFIYTMAKSAQSYFKDQVMKLDDPDNPIYTTSKTREVDDEEAISKAKAPYAGKFRIAAERWEEYKNSHPDEFEDREQISSVSIEYDVSSFRPNIPLTLNDAIQGYWSASELLKKYGKGSDEYDRLPKYVAKVSKEDFKDKHAGQRKLIAEQLGIPDDDVFKIKKVEERRSMKPGKHPDASDEKPLMEYTKEFMHHICE